MVGRAGTSLRHRAIWRQDREKIDGDERRLTLESVLDGYTSLTENHMNMSMDTLGTHSIALLKT
jgi:hypothetical protein